MTYDVLLHEKAEDELHNLDGHKQDRIRKALQKLQQRPDQRGKPLKGGYWRLRIGDHRAIYEIRDDAVIVLYIGHRKNVYDDFSNLF